MENNKKLCDAQHCITNKRMCDRIADVKSGHTLLLSIKSETAFFCRCMMSETQNTECKHVIKMHQNRFCVTLYSAKMQHYNGFRCFSTFIGYRQRRMTFGGLLRTLCEATS